MLKFEQTASVTDILRNGKLYFDDLAEGHTSQILVVKNSQPTAVLLSPDEYERLNDGSRELLAHFQIMRLKIMSMYLQENNPFGLAYVYAWDSGVFPLLHEGADWHAPFEGCFRVSEDEANRVFKVLCDRWDDKNPITFYELEDHFEVRSGRTSLDRSKLLYICRYFFLEGCRDGLKGAIRSLDLNAWQTLVTNGKCPSEAHSIVGDPSDEKFYFM